MVQYDIHVAMWVIFGAKKPNKHVKQLHVDP